MQGIENLSDIAKLDLRYTLVVGLKILAENWANMTQLLLLGKFEYTRGPIFKVVLEC